MGIVMAGVPIGAAIVTGVAHIRKKRDAVCTRNCTISRDWRVYQFGIWKIRKECFMKKTFLAIATAVVFPCLMGSAQTNAPIHHVLQNDGAAVRTTAVRLTHHPGQSQYDHEVRLGFTIQNDTPETIISMIIKCEIRNPFQELVFDQRLKFEGVIQPNIGFEMDTWWVWRNTYEARSVYEKLWAIAANNTARVSARVIALVFSTGRIWYHDSIVLDELFPQYQNQDDTVRLAAIESITNFAIRDAKGNGFIHRACETGVTNGIIYQRLIAKGASVHQKNNEGQTPLHLAPCAPVARILLDAGARVDERDRSGKTPLMRACGPRYWRTPGEPLSLVAFLLGAGADVNAKDTNDRSVIENLFYLNSTSVYELLIEKGARYTLLDTIQRNDQRRTDQLIARREGINLTRFDGQSTWTPVRYAVDKGDLDLVKRLVQAGANPQFSCPKTRINLIHHAVNAKNEEVLRYLLALRIPHSIRSSMGTTPLEYAQEKKWHAGVAMLRQFGAR